ASTHPTNCTACGTRPYFRSSPRKRGPRATRRGLLALSFWIPACAGMSGPHETGLLRRRRGRAQDRAELVLERGERLEQRGGVGRAHPRRPGIGGIVGKVLLVLFFVQHDRPPAHEIARPSHRLWKVNGRLSTSARRGRA